MLALVALRSHAPMLSCTQGDSLATAQRYLTFDYLSCHNRLALISTAIAAFFFLLSAARKLGHRKKQMGDGYLSKTVAVITPYGAQKRLIIGLLAKHVVIAEVMHVEVDTVDSFQGSEADIVLYSTVRTHGNISFLLDRQRLNVACSRARENLVFFGATRFLCEREARSKKFLFSTIMERAKYDHGSSTSSGKPQARYVQKAQKRA